jgi:ATP-dependent exoDNAse (exonuclease V) beta subunit
MSPTEAVESVIAGCGLTRRTLQWQQTPDVARLRLANLDRLVQLAAEYEDERRAASASATLSGFIRRLDELEERGLDELPEPGIDAVRVMTHHRAKGLEWPVVVACDLAANIRDRLWGISAESPQGVDVADPLRNRFLRYWPWPFGRQRRVPVAERIAESAAGKAVRQAAVEEERRLLYVSLTRARDVLVLARPEKAPDGEWMDTVGLGERLDSAKENALPLTKGTSILFRRSVLEADTADLPARPRTRDLHWFAPAEGVAEKLPLRVSPSKTSAVSCRVAESATIGSRMDTSGAIDRQMVGDVLHSCIAAEMASKGGGVSEAEVVEVIRRAGLGAKLAAADVRRQVRAVREWIGKRWPGATPYVEVPLMNVTATGQEVAGRVDLLLRSKDGWVLLDHKSTPEGSARWKAIADAYGGQLSGYKYAIEGATGEAVPEVWLVMPVAGAAIRVERDAL